MVPILLLLKLPPENKVIVYYQKKLLLIIFLIFFHYSNNSFAAEACEWIFSKGYYQEYLDDLPPSDFHSAFYIVVGTNIDGYKDCTYGYQWDSSDRTLTDVKREAKAYCDKYKLEFKIEGECRPYDINKEIVWGDAEVKIDIYENMDAIKEFCEITKICDDDFFSTYLKAEQHKAIAVVRKLGSENEYFLNLDGRHTGASSREIANTKALEQCEEKKIGFKDLQDYENYECKIIIYNNAIINENYVAWAEKLLKNNYEELKALEKSIPIPDEVSEAFIKMHNRAFDENKKTFVYDDGITYLVSFEKIDIKVAVVMVEPVHYCKGESGYVSQANKPCKLFNLVEVYLTPEEFLALKEKNEKIKKQVEAKILAKKKEKNNLLSFEKEIKFINPKDDKKGRSLVDRPDINSDYKIHVMYILTKDEKDREMDINGKLEKMVFQMNDMFFKATSNTKKNKAKGKDKGHRLKLDLTEEGKLDVTFVRLPWNTKDMYKECKKWMGNDCPHLVDFVNNYLATNEYFERKKVYSILFDIYEFGSGEGYWGHANVSYLYPPGFNVPWGYTYYKGCASDGKKTCVKVMLHELMHSFGFTKACHQFSIKDDPAHQTKGGDLMYSGPDGNSGYKIDKNNESYYLHGDSNCPDLADVVYLIPTSPNAFDPSIRQFN